MKSCMLWVGVMNRTDRIGMNILRFYGEILEAEEKITISKALKKVKNKTIIIGPEGDFSLDEINFAKEYNYNEVTLGSSRLRAETAAIVACSLMLASE